MSNQPVVVIGNNANLTNTALSLLEKKAVNSILSCKYSRDELISIFKTVDCIFTDADGTVVKEGLTSLSAEYSAYIQELADIGIATTLITGKPYAEVSKLVESLPQYSPLRIIYEKGAYCLKTDRNGVMLKHYLLSTPELEASVGSLRKLFLKHKLVIEKKYRAADGKQLVTLGWSGSGAHQSVLSIDILAGIPPTNYIQIVGTAREDLKLKDSSLLTEVEADLQEFVDTYRPGWRLVHLGNGNSEIAPGPIEKDMAITQTSEFKNAASVLLWGDSGNDRKMFELRRLSKAHAGLVLHRKTSIDLVNEADFVSFGMANVKPFFELLLSSHTNSDNK